MTIDADNPHLPDDVPIGDAVEQQRPVDADAEDDLDRDHLAEPLQRDANIIDVIDQAIIVAWPDDDRDADTIS
ncbi:hypothetical protein [Mycobacterium intracellulare]|jgi:hypothetical protein|uniref:hypothetical protein n=1 Tax=Mycobacterium intracellulare TaxID=1767 RepID=UPI001915DD81|nr:hypothetical protein [Mycobacterium intracellulare]BCO71178.1 hypothetical protein MINTM008_05130 [Mycobacterium intracellulare]BCO76729.1 hypothetical protein MINTM009_05110 [Mycobacterium intracellulare]BCP29543.1 hypothetical protein MINTM026_05130 [Mycobacterium intracellulare]BCP40419.1 hypothetical protein MINTMi27_05120 [Mycobacterium intracellulare]